MTDLTDKYRGTLLGMACGDALGAQVEFKNRGTFAKQVNMTGAGPHCLRPGEWTDDTAMALILAHHLRDDPYLDMRWTLAGKWVRWWRQGEGSCTGECFDIGNQTRSALAHWELRGEAPSHAKASRGNGALMRVAPVALAHPFSADARRRVVRAQTTITHPTTCTAVCVAFANLVSGGVCSTDPTYYRDTLAQVAPEIAGRKRREVESRGFDVHTYEAALWAVCNSDDPEEAIVRAVNLGGDADTVGAVTGALAGAIWGARALPERWLSRVAWRNRIEILADNLCGQFAKL